MRSMSTLINYILFTLFVDCKVCEVLKQIRNVITFIICLLVLIRSKPGHAILEEVDAKGAYSI